VSLYTSVYWTKRVFVVFGILLFLCSGFRVFQFVTKKFTKTRVTQSDAKPELGFGKTIDRINIIPLSDLPAGFSPTEFRNTTRTGNFDVQNGYPLESTRSPLANVYKILDRTIDIKTSEDPQNIAKKFGFKGDPVLATSTVKAWEEGDRRIEVNGQYLLISYENRTLKGAVPPKDNAQALSYKDSNAIKAAYEENLKNFGIQTDLTSYRFETVYLNYNSQSKKYEITDSPLTAQYIRLVAKRVYNNVVKTNDSAQTNAAYPDYLSSNNYITLPASIPRGAKASDYIVDLNLYNWPIDQSTGKQNKNIQTYNIKTPKKAYEEFTKNSNNYLVSGLEWETNKSIDLSELSGIQRVELFKIRIEMYEDIVNTNLIQPVYVFVCQARNGEKLYQLVYYVPAVTNVNE
jgi:hypothetical protein